MQQGLVGQCKLCFKKFSLTNHSEIDLPYPSGRPLEVHSALVEAGILGGHPEEWENGSGLGIGVKLNFGSAAVATAVTLMVVGAVAVSGG